MLILGTQASEVLPTQTSATGAAHGFGGSDSLTASVSGVQVALTTQDGGAGNDTLSATLAADTTTTGGSAIADNSQIGGFGNDTFFADISATAAGDATATNKITDLSGASVVNAKATAARPVPPLPPSVTPTAAYANNIVETGASADQITVGAYSDHTATNVLRSGRGNDVISATANLTAGDYGYRTNQHIAAGAGNDDITASTNIAYGYSGTEHNTTVDAGSGNDTVTVNVNGGTEYGTTVVEVDGGANNDFLTSNVNTATLDNCGVLVLMDGGTGSDTVISSINSSGFTADAGVTLEGGGGNDDLLAETTLQSGVDSYADHTLDGGAGHDTLKSHVDLTGSVTGGAFVTLVGSFGNDVLQSAVELGDTEGQLTVQTLSGDGGSDLLCATTTTLATNPLWANFNPIEHRLMGGTGEDTLRSEMDTDMAGTIHTLDGGSGSDLIAAIGGGGMVISGGNGNDVIISSARSGHVNGGDGNDTIDADGASTKYLTGGAGADSFHVDTATDQGYRGLLDWDSSQDILVFEDITDTNGNGEIWDEINAQIVSVANAGGNMNMVFAGGSTLDFVNSAGQLTGPVTDIRSYVDDTTTQLISGADLVPPIC